MQHQEKMLWGFEKVLLSQRPSGSSSPGRATASQAVGSGFESRLPLDLTQASPKESIYFKTPSKNFFVASSVLLFSSALI